MSVIRMSFDLRNLDACDQDTGEPTWTDYDPIANRGRIREPSRGSFIESGTHLADFLDDACSVRMSGGQAMPANSPIVVMVHGFGFDPAERSGHDDNPHGFIYHFNPVTEHGREEARHSTPWPLELGFQDNNTDPAGVNGTAVAFGWNSRPGAGTWVWTGLSALLTNPYKFAYYNANDTAWMLAACLERISRHPAAAGRPIDLFAHSLGTRTVNYCLWLLCHAGTQGFDVISRLGRIVLLAGSEFSRRGRDVVDRIDDLQDRGLLGSGPELYNVIQSGDAVLRIGAEPFGPIAWNHLSDRRSIGRSGLAGGAPAGSRWLDIRLDDPGHVGFWAGQGYALAAEAELAPSNHWVHFTNDGNMSLWRDILRRRPGLSIAEIELAGGRL